jgi:hypothetical protein
MLPVFSQTEAIGTKLTNSSGAGSKPRSIRGLIEATLPIVSIGQELDDFTFRMLES